MPSDIDPESGFRLPLPKREDLDEIAKQAYDEAATPGKSVAGLQGPAGIQLYSPQTIPHLRGLYQYLRFDAGLGARTREIAILAVARELDCQFQWVMHERVALKESVTEHVIDIIRMRQDTKGPIETDAVVIELGREIYGKHAVSSETFARAKAQFGAKGLVDLVLLMGSAATTSTLLTAFDMQLRPEIKPTLPIP